MEYPRALVERLRGARRVAVLTGAGISAESGVPTFRDAQSGLWANFKPEDLATPEAFERNPKLVWEWYAFRRERVQSVQPNPGHYALAALERRLPDFLLLTQNVDGLHHRAGSRKLVEVHGNILRTRCYQEDVVIESWPETKEIPPRCPRCGSWLRPDVVWFGESLPPGAFEQAELAASTCEIFLSVGTSTLVYPAATLPYAALRSGAMVVEVNPQPTPFSDKASFALRGPSGQILPELVKAAWPDYQPDA
jgi:NAD-dependent deacetylase